MSTLFFKQHTYKIPSVYLPNLFTHIFILYLTVINKLVMIMVMVLIYGDVITFKAGQFFEIDCCFQGGCATNALVTCKF